jgi:hypothetical protein
MKSALKWLADRGISVREPQAFVEHKHSMASPFPYEVGVLIKSKVTDERCTCGQLKTQHADSHHFGTGPAFDGGCEQFTWDGYVFSEPRFPHYTQGVS